MKGNRNEEIKTLSENIELTLQHENDRFIAFTKDSDKFDAMPLINEVITNFRKNKRIAVVSYEKVNVSVDNIVIDALTDNRETVLEKTEGYDIVVVICPNVIEKNNYLQMAQFVKLCAIVCKKWKTKTAKVTEIKDNLTRQNISVLGIVYEN